MSINYVLKVSLLYVLLMDHYFQELFNLYCGLYFEIKQQISHSRCIYPLNTDGEVRVVPGHFVPFFFWCFKCNRAIEIWDRLSFEDNKVEGTDEQISHDVMRQMVLKKWLVVAIKYSHSNHILSNAQVKINISCVLSLCNKEKESLVILVREMAKWNVHNISISQFVKGNGQLCKWF